MSLDGVLNLHKPSGPTSFQMVARVRRLSGERRLGHAGTLDPLASGVLPLCLGQATRLVEFLSAWPKTYRGKILLGVATDTYDAAGKVTYQGDPSLVTEESLEAVLHRFRGPIQQVPPPYSAVKHRGKPLYWWARAGVEVPREPRPVEVFRLELRSWQPPEVVLEVECSKGTYLRSLAHDLGQALGCGAHLRELVRTRYGPLALEEALRIEDLERATAQGRLQELLWPIDKVLEPLPSLVLSEEEEKAVRTGRDLRLPRLTTREKSWIRAYNREGSLLALLRPRNEDFWHPEKVFLPLDSQIRL